jgi:hypothetical protein
MTEIVINGVTIGGFRHAWDNAITWNEYHLTDGTTIKVQPGDYITGYSKLKKDSDNDEQVLISGQVLRCSVFHGQGIFVIKAVDGNIYTVTMDSYPLTLHQQDADKPGLGI